MASVLSIHQLTKYYGSMPAINGISFEVPERSVFGILGPNGSGKTTLLATVMDVLKPHSGSCRWFGAPSNPASRKRIGTLLETPNFYPYLSAEDNLALSAKIKGCPLLEVKRVLEVVGLAGRGKSRFRTYSLGMKQRLALASTLLGDPPVIVLDEPTNGLDPSGIADIRELIRQMGAGGKTVIMASHLLDEVERVCTHVAILKKGQLLALGSVGEVLSTEEIVELAAPDMGRLEEVLRAHPHISSVRRVEDVWQAMLREPLSGEALNEYCFARHVTLSVLRRKKNSLELKFIELTGTAKNESGPKPGLS